jgi:hypothetical protein
MVFVCVQKRVLLQQPRMFRVPNLPRTSVFQIRLRLKIFPPVCFRSTKPCLLYTWCPYVLSSRILCPLVVGELEDIDVPLRAPSGHPSENYGGC